jgi:hypothetical protein
MRRISNILVSILFSVTLAACMRDYGAEAKQINEFGRANCKNVLSDDDMNKMSLRELLLAAEAAALAGNEWAMQAAVDSRDHKGDPCLQAQAIQRRGLLALADTKRRLELQQQLDQAKRSR